MAPRSRRSSSGRKSESRKMSSGSSGDTWIKTVEIFLMVFLLIWLGHLLLYSIVDDYREWYDLTESSNPNFDWLIWVVILSLSLLCTLSTMWVASVGCMSSMWSVVLWVTFFYAVLFGTLVAVIALADHTFKGAFIALIVIEGAIIGLLVSSVCWLWFCYGPTMVCH